jgi:cobalt/nickel transport system permease protein
VKSALARSLRDITERLEQSLTAEEISRHTGLLQSLDVRVKMVTILVLILAASLTHNLISLAALYMLALVLAIVSAIPAGYFIGRVWLALPFLTGIVALPALFLTPGPPLALLPFGLIVTRTGALTVLFLLLRVSTSISLSLLLILTTPWSGLLRALTVLRIPDVLVLVLGMTYRYIYVLLRITNDMFLSRQSRTVGRLSPRQERSTEGAIAGTLLVYSLDMSSEVYLAMQSRGFTGYSHILKPGHIEARDYTWIAFVAVFISLMIVLEFLI